MTGAEAIAAERQRQIEEEGYDAEHDAGGSENLAFAGASYVLIEAMRKNGAGDLIPGQWPWNGRFWKPTPDDRRRELVKAGALIAAAIDALDEDAA